jgi:enoyl-CoA hydratase
MENVILEKQGHVSIITINREKALNALSTAVLKDLEEAVNTVEADKVLIVPLLPVPDLKAL